MSLNHLNQFQADNIYSINMSTIQLTILIVGLIEFLLLHIFIDGKKIHNLNKSGNSKTPNPMNEKESEFEQSVSRGDMEVVVRSLGMFWNPEEEEEEEEEEEVVPAKFDVNDVFALFEERNPSLDEAREAFGVFDKNGDRFIDAEELQIVLCDLGFVEGLEMENCRRMIRVLDDNGDGRIDFEEFLKFMEICLW